MAKTENITAERVLQLLDYERKTGTLRWKVATPDMFQNPISESYLKTRNTRFAGAEAGCVMKSGYRIIRIDDVLYLRHRLIWLLEKGELPEDEIDHVDGVEAGDQIGNLRLATRHQQQQNMRISKRSTSRVTGVSWNRNANKWMAYVSVDGKRIYLGIFADLDKAVAARKQAKKEHHSFHPAQVER